VETPRSGASDLCDPLLLIGHLANSPLTVQQSKPKQHPPREMLDSLKQTGVLLAKDMVELRRKHAGHKLLLHEQPGLTLDGRNPRSKAARV
jgi:hypothetical protein